MNDDETRHRRPRLKPAARDYFRQIERGEIPNPLLKLGEVMGALDETRRAEKEGKLESEIGEESEDEVKGSETTHEDAGDTQNKETQ